MRRFPGKAPFLPSTRTKPPQRTAVSRQGAKMTAKDAKKSEQV